MSPTPRSLNQLVERALHRPVRKHDGPQQETEGADHGPRLHADGCEGVFRRTGPSSQRRPAEAKHLPRLRDPDKGAARDETKLPAGRRLVKKNGQETNRANHIKGRPSGAHRYVAAKQEVIGEGEELKDVNVQEAT
eukprot:CAMPEP_0171669050 /NCGR_PEP_ID=MMETSP0990-20121206/49736_1 /TAXON_ID=483369 /ORGANISM="non described non described, Strain CCMP2098" /LENGTH=135 /DNA_ID=CAMNT_0012253221 /DNA_START=119 /DNA_END=527 /DNA_ORIENTATION=-